MVDIPASAFIWPTAQGLVQVTWTASVPNLYLKMYAPELPSEVTLQENQPSAPPYLSAGGGNLGIEVWEVGAANPLQATQQPPTSTNWELDYGTWATVKATLTPAPGVPALTGMRFNFHVGHDQKPGNMAIEVLIAPASNKDNPFAGYAEPRPTSDIATAPSNPPDAMHQPMKPYPANQLTTVDMMMLRPVTPDDLNAIVRIWVDPQPGYWLSRADSVTFIWAAVLQWNGAWGREISPGEAWTLGRESGQPSYAEHPAYIDPATANP